MQTRCLTSWCIRRFTIAMLTMVRGSAVHAQQHETGAAAEVLALEQQIEEAIVRGDLAFVDRATPADFSFVHGDGCVEDGH